VGPAILRWAREGARSLGWRLTANPSTAPWRPIWSAASTTGSPQGGQFLVHPKGSMAKGRSHRAGGRSRSWGLLEGVLSAGD